MDLLPLDRLPGLEKTEIADLRALRYSDAGRLLLRVLTECPQPRAALGDMQEHDHSYLLGRRECYDSLVQAFRLIGTPDETLRPTSLPSYRLTKTTKPEKADDS